MRTRAREALIRAVLPIAAAALLTSCAAPVAPAPPAAVTAGPAAETPAAGTGPSAPPSAPRTEVPLAAPIHVTIRALRIDADVEEYTDAQVAASGGWVNPVHRDVVAWWSGGGTPGQPADNTVYLYGHVSASPAVFNTLAEAAVGDVIELTTGSGVLTYHVTQVLPPVLKADLPDVPQVAEVSPGRLVLIGCHRDADQGRRPTTKNTVVIAEQADTVR